MVHMVYGKLTTVKQRIRSWGRNAQDWDEMKQIGDELRNLREVKMGAKLPTNRK